MLFTSIHQISEQLKRRGEARDKSKSYSYAQIREGLQVLAKTKIHLRSESDDDDLVLSPIADLGHFSGKASRDAAKATIFIRFNALISQAILSRSWRQINYERIMDADIYLVRWLTKMLGLRFTYASPSKTYNIKLSTVIENSGVTLYDRMSDNLKMVEHALKAMPDIVARYTVDKELGPNARNATGRALVDAKIIIRPTHAFSIEQLKTNVHENRLDTAVVTAGGAVAVEPRREDARACSTTRRPRVRGGPQDRSGLAKYHSGALTRLRAIFVRLASGLEEHSSFAGRCQKLSCRRVRFGSLRQPATPTLWFPVARDGASSA